MTCVQKLLTLRSEKDFILATLIQPFRADPVQSLRENWFDRRQPISWRRCWLGGREYWACQLMGWFGLGIWHIATTHSDDVAALRWLAPYWFLVVLAGIVTTHILRVMIFFLRERLYGWRFYAGLVPGVLAAAAALLGAAMTATWIVLGSSPGVIARPSVMGFIQRLILAGGWTGFYLVFSSYRNFREGLTERLRLEAALKEAELRALKAQVNPHFLFNSLNSLRALIPCELERPREAVTMLAKVLRASLTAGQQEMVSLEQELTTLDDYLALERLRYTSRLRVSRRISPDALAWSVPPLLVQSLVENAVKHGIASSEEGGDISVTADVRGDTLYLCVTNPGTITHESDSTGLGLNNIRARLRCLFGPAAQLTLIQRDADLVAAEVIVPRSLAAPVL